MKPCFAFVIISAALLLVSCGNSTVPEKSGPAQVRGPEKTTAARAATRPVDFLRLSSVRLSPPAPTAATDLSAEAVVAPPEPEESEFHYRWFVNDKEVEEAGDATLACGNFRKKQWLHCLARVTSGERTSDWLHSKRVLIANSSPKLEASAMEDFAVPGQFDYRISAMDPDQDALTFELLAPLGQGIDLDSRTGVLTWKLDEEAVQRLGTKIEIKFAVSDGDGGKSSGTITLNLSKPQ